MAFTCWNSIVYSCIRMWTCPVPGLSRKVPIIGGKTLPEIIVAVAVVGGLIAVALSIDSRSVGSIIEYLGFVLIFFAVRQNFVLQAIGIGYERGLLWHKVVGFSLLPLVLIHGIGEGNNTTGIVFAVAMFVAAASYFAYRIHGNFDLFYYPHIACAFVTIPIAFLHKAPLFGIAGIIWAVDVIVRDIVRGRQCTAQATIVSDEVLQLTVTKCDLHHHPGQYAFIMVKDVNRYEFHPFTITENPVNIGAEGVSTTFLIKRSGDWTQQLYDTVRSKGENAVASETNKSVDLQVWVEGPYGSVSINHRSRDLYPVVVLVAGGIGITPMLAFLAELARQNTQEIVVVWTVRDVALGNHCYHQIVKPALAAASTANPSAHSGNVRKVGDAGSYAKVDGSEGAGGGGETESNSPTITNGSTSSAQQLKITWHFHCTGKDVSVPLSTIEAGGSKEEVLQWKKGRADLPAIFGAAAERVAAVADAADGSATGRHSKRVGVMVCGPNVLVSDVRDYCDNSLVRCASGVRFDCHEEIFDF